MSNWASCISVLGDTTFAVVMAICVREKRATLYAKRHVISIP